jgi:trimethylamine:corrinoid methyltransferase-like protein
MRSGEWLIPRIGIHETQQAWKNAGKKDILEEARAKVEHILSTHTPLPLSSDVWKELENLYKRAQESQG